MLNLNKIMKYVKKINPQHCKVFLALWFLVYFPTVFVAYKMRVVILFLVTIPCIQGYKAFKSKEDAEATCRHQKHLVLNPEFSCCNHQVVTNGLINEKAWETCFNDPQNKAGTVQEAAWNVYKCVIKEVNNNDASITLSKFAELASASYDEDIKSKILEKAGTMSDSANLEDENFAPLDKLRILYYGIEREVCEGISVELAVSKCSRGEESVHRGGECCSETAFPFPITYDSWLGKDMTETQKQCRGTIKSAANMLQPTQKKHQVPEVMLANLGEMCDSMCVHNNDPQSSVWYFVSWEFIMDRISFNIGSLLPPWLPESIAADAIKFAKERININATIEEIDMYEFSDAVPGNASADAASHFTVHVKNVTNEEGKVVGQDFAPRRFPNYLMHIPVHCTVVKKLLAYAEMYITKTDNCVAASLPADGSGGEASPASEAPPSDDTTGEPQNDSGTTESDSSAGETAESNVNGETGTGSSTSTASAVSFSSEGTSP